MISLAVSGFEHALENLAAAVSPVNDRRISEHGLTALEPIAETARRLVPVDSGDLRETITVSYEFKTAEKDGRAVYVGPIASGVTSGFNHVFYAHFIEYGTVLQRAQPFMAPAVHQHIDLVFEVLGKRIGEDMVSYS